MWFAAALSASAVAMLLWVGLSVAGRLNILSRPFFAAPMGVPARLDDLFVFGLAVVSGAALLISGALVIFLVDRRRRRAGVLEPVDEARLHDHEELEQLYRTAPIGLSLHDLSLRYVRINERLAAINGRPVEAHIGKMLRDVVPEIAVTVEPLLARVVESGEAILDIEVRGSTPARPDVERLWMTSYYPLKAKSGEVLGVNAVVLDISERVWAEQRARQHLEDLAHVSRLSTMGEMAAGIAHELNQPLTAMANFAFIGMHTLDGDKTEKAESLRDLFTELSEQALRAGDIVQHLRAFVRKSSPPRGRLSISALIADVLTLMDADLRLHGICREVISSQERLEARADAIQIQQVVVNLLRNAVESMIETPGDERRLTIEASLLGQGFVEVTVADTGPGLSAADCERIFAAFFTTKATGMGMGLAISRSIVEDHGGRLWAERGARGGAVFRFTLPRIEDEGDRES